ncbi:MAG: dihydrodipicolinate synthase family protein [Planctomycetes bacterium]|nr:dihydrodipicolinate synthase family protein [Planctomycetota bacterium]
MDDQIRKILRRGIAIPAHPLALTANRKLDERRQRGLSRYYVASGVGGLAVGVHTTQFEIRNPKVKLFEPVLALAAEEMNRADANRSEPLVRVAGICGETRQAVIEATTARDLGYHAGLLNLSALKKQTDAELIDHCRAVAEVIAVFGFYLNPEIGGRVLSYAFWREFCKIENVVAIKMAPFNRYRTLDVVRAVAESGREDISLYTGNDDNIVLDLITPFSFQSQQKGMTRRITGGLLGHWAVWTSKAVEILQQCQSATADSLPKKFLHLNTAVTDCNAAFFDAANNFRGCIPGLHEVLRRQGLLDGIWCLDENETLSPGQLQEIDRVYASYPELNDDPFVAQHLDDWLRG